jgi:hypothetical protein
LRNPEKQSAKEHNDHQPLDQQAGLPQIIA